jgi:hypothetical protein
VAPLDEGRLARVTGAIEELTGRPPMPLEGILRTALALGRIQDYDAAAVD